MPINPDPYILVALRAALIEDDWCPECLGDLDAGGECNRCNFDTAPEWLKWVERLESRS